MEVDPKCGLSVGLQADIFMHDLVNRPRIDP